MGLIEDAIKLVLSAVWTFCGATTLKEFKQLRAELFQAFEFYANVDTSNPILRQGPQSVRAEEARIIYSQMAGRVSGFKELAFYKRWLLPTEENLESARADLVRLSNETGKPEAAVKNHDRQHRVRKALKTTC